MPDQTRPRVLVVASGDTSSIPNEDPHYRTVLDARLVQGVPRGWRRIEQALRMDLLLAWRAKQREDAFDVLYADSEQVGIPLALLGLRKPLVVTIHNWSRARRVLARLLRLHRRWAAAGYITADQREFLRGLGLPEERLFRAFSVRLERFPPAGPPPADGALVSLGSARRDYAALIEALRGLPGCATRIYASSKYGDPYRGGAAALPGWVQFAARVADEEIPAVYQQARFVVIPLERGAHSGAGITVALEAAASARAVIATRTPGTPDFVKDGETGLIVPPGDPAALRAAIQRLWLDPALAERMGRAGRRLMEEQFDFDKNVLRIQQILKEVSGVGMTA